MIKNIGKIISMAVQRGKPILTKGRTCINSEKFSLSNPYILEVIPDKTSAQLSIFEGKKLSTVCRILDRPDLSKFMQRYETFVNHFKKGFTNQELKGLFQKAGIRGKNPLNVNLDAMVYMAQLDGTAVQHFDAHGIAKGTLTEQLEQLNKLLTKGIDKTKRFYTAPLDLPNDLRAGVGAAIGTPGGGAYRDGSFIIVSDKGKKIIDNGIKHVIVNDAYYNIIDDLAIKFPHINFVKAENVAQYFNKI